MKPYFHIIIFAILLITIPACQQHTDYPPAMQQAEKLMNNRPDSALHLLESMADTLIMLPNETQMYYQLLTIQAKDKLYITHTSDSLINRIVSFYEDYGDKERLMLAYYYQGSVYRDMNDAPKALKAFHQAMDLNVPNYDLQAKTYNQMGTLFMYQGLYDEVIRVNQKAIELYILQGKNNKISYFQRDIARMYDIKNMPDRALHYYKEACHTALTDGDSARYYGILGELGGVYYAVGNIDKAQKLLEKIEHSVHIPNKTHIYTTLGHIFEKKGNQDSAYFYYKKTLNQGDIRNAYYSYKNMFNIEKKNSNYLQAVKHIDKALLLKDSIDFITQTEVVAKINALYNYQHIENENHRLSVEKEKQKRQIVLLLLFFSLSALGGVIFYFIQRTKKQEELNAEKSLRNLVENNYAKSQKAIQENEEKIKDLNFQLQKALKKHDLLTAKQVQMKQECLQVHNERIVLLQKEQELQIAGLRNSPIYKEFKQASVNENVNISFINNPEKWALLRKAIDKAYPYFIEQIHLIYPHLSATEEQVCLLTKLGIPPSGIATIQKCSRQCISNIRTRIHKKIQAIGGKYSNFDDFIDSF